MDDLIKNLTENCKLTIKDTYYAVKTKTWYSITEDNSTKYIKCELSNNKVLVILPDDNIMYIGQVIENMNYKKISEHSIKYNNATFNKTGEGHQYIINIDFGNTNEVEGNCTFEDYESENNLISLGFLPDKNIRADVYAEFINLNEITIK